MHGLIYYGTSSRLRNVSQLCELLSHVHATCHVKQGIDNQLVVEVQHNLNKNIVSVIINAKRLKQSPVWQTLENIPLTFHIHVEMDPTKLQALLNSMPS